MLCHLHRTVHDRLVVSKYDSLFTYWNIEIAKRSVELNNPPNASTTSYELCFIVSGLDGCLLLGIQIQRHLVVETRDTVVETKDTRKRSIRGLPSCCAVVVFLLPTENVRVASVVFLRIIFRTYVFLRDTKSSALAAEKIHASRKSLRQKIRVTRRDHADDMKQDFP